MSRLSLPLLIVGRRLSQDMLRMQSKCMPGYAATFSTLAKASGFLEAYGESSWEFTVVTRPAMPELICDLERHGLLGICHDQLPDGTAGTAFTLAELREQFVPSVGGQG